ELLIPPWQMADEHAHVAWTEVMRSRLLASQTTDPGREAEIIESMVRYNWWPHYGFANPTPPLPRRFIQAPASHTIGIESATSRFPKLFYGTVAGALSLVPTKPVVTDLYVMRILSAALSLMTFWIAALRVTGASDLSTAATVVALLAVHPQFVVASTSAGPDAVVHLAGA